MAVSASESQSFSGEPPGWENLDLVERERRRHAILAMESSQAQTPAGFARAFNRAMRELRLEEPTRAELRAERKALRAKQPKLTPEQVDKNAYCQPTARERCPRDTPARRPPGWAATRAEPQEVPQQEHSINSEVMIGSRL
jgi:hypothetical protein